MASQDGRNLSDALVQFGRDQGLMLALYMGDDWQRMLKQMLRITDNAQARKDIRRVLVQVDKALQVIRGFAGSSDLR